MAKLIIKKARVIDPFTDTDDTFDILIEGERVKGVRGKREERRGKREEGKMINAKGLWVIPGLIDMHTHLREPGREDEETILSGTMSALKGGYQAVVCMANTEPPVDNIGIVRYIQEAEKVCDVYPVGAVTKGLKGTELSEIGDLVDAGCVAVSDDGMPIMDSFIMRRALEYCKQFDIPVISHAEDLNLSPGVVNEGIVSTELGLSGIPSCAEEAMIARDILLAKFTKSRLHIAHISTKGSVELIRRAKKEGVNVTCEATPHHFSLTDECVRSFDTNYRINPPLRTEVDRKAIIEGLLDDTIDAIATDHAPHADFEKELEFDQAPSGVIGLETAFACGITYLVKPGFMDIKQLLQKFTLNPAKIFSIPVKGISTGEYANLAIVDPAREWVPQRFLSKSKNSPFIDKKLYGKVLYTFYKGRVYEWKD
ncbi:MAG: dihydroorotase [bacterium (Candidatus Stahlbacteria) CG08_land_8_20_14_0_20_40_26]|nr:MAG: dihydroorotase [bacterium (Candidatus Stahlbacteria) CG23_combo_of_CG06-09_8_20_14_all_40_9]PIS26705.1 MAG: dihydroorotase [bacterium (Candidatus Stahlbacteria) CG08_land_8_20_14_0_20_40_26]